MSKAARLELLAALRYVMIDVLESNRGRWVAAIVFLATWGSLALLFMLWGRGSRVDPRGGPGDLYRLRLSLIGNCPPIAIFPGSLGPPEG